MEDEKSPPHLQVERLPPERFAALIVDALVDAGVIKSENFDRAVAVVAEEIFMRRLLGDG